MKRSWLVIGSAALVLATAWSASYWDNRRTGGQHQDTLSVDIAAPRQKVWDVLTDLSVMPQWMPDTARVELQQLGSMEILWCIDEQGRRSGFWTAVAKPPSEMQRYGTVLKDGPAGQRPPGGNWVIYLEAIDPTHTRLKIFVISATSPARIWFDVPTTRLRLEALWEACGIQAFGRAKQIHAFSQALEHYLETHPTP